MLQTVTLDGFRSFAEPRTVPLAPLTILAGKNNVGKSSVISVLVALVQTVERGGGLDLALRGDWVNLGRFEEVINSQRPKDDWRFAIGLSHENAGDAVVDVMWEFGEAPDVSGSSSRDAHIEALELTQGDDYYRLVRPSGPENRGSALLIPEEKGSGKPLAMADLGRGFWVPPDIATDWLYFIPEELRRLRYLSAYRAPPRTMFESRDANLGPPLGRYGQHAAEYLYTHRAHRTGLLPGGADGEANLVQAVNLWNTYVFDTSIGMRINEIERIGYALDIETEGGDRLTLETVGLGISQALPMLPLVLGSEVGDIIAIETPEAHLHPGAQHRLTELFVAAAASGRQVIIETHSEHVINGVRLAVKDGRLRPDQVSLLFFEQDEGVTDFTIVDLDERGRPMAWPEGFFDQAAKDLAGLI